MPSPSRLGRLLLALGLTLGGLVAARATTPAFDAGSTRTPRARSCATAAAIRSRSTTAPAARAAEMRDEIQARIEQGQTGEQVIARVRRRARRDRSASRRRRAASTSWPGSARSWACSAPRSALLAGRCGAGSRARASRTRGHPGPPPRRSSADAAYHARLRARDRGSAMTLVVALGPAAVVAPRSSSRRCSAPTPREAERVGAVVSEERDLASAARDARSRRCGTSKTIERRARSTRRTMPSSTRACRPRRSTCCDSSTRSTRPGAAVDPSESPRGAPPPPVRPRDRRAGAAGHDRGRRADASGSARCPALDGVSISVVPRRIPGPLRPERRGQDHADADPDPGAAADLRHRPRRWASIRAATTARFARGSA